MPTDRTPSTGQLLPGAPQWWWDWQLWTERPPAEAPSSPPRIPAQFPRADADQPPASTGGDLAPLVIGGVVLGLVVLGVGVTVAVVASRR